MRYGDECIFLFLRAAVLVRELVAFVSLFFPDGNRNMYNRTQILLLSPPFCLVF